MTPSLNKDVRQAILKAVDDGFARQVEFLETLCRFPSTRGNEKDIQRFLAEQLVTRGYAVDVWELREEDLCDLRGFSPVLEPYVDAFNVVGTSRSTAPTGRSIILNGHVVVVPTGPLEMWASRPFEPRVEDAWMYGRGAGDMKAGLSCNVFALDALKSLGYRPAADCHLQFVIEEEATGNGALACLQRGYRAEAALIPEPFGESLVTAQVGVLWLRVEARGVPSHVAHASAGVNAIEAAIPLIVALRDLEVQWNSDARRPIEFVAVPHPLNLNVGRFEGGDWPSSVPAWASFDVRMGLYPGDDINQAEARLRACLQAAAARSPYLRENPPEITCHGFRAEGCSLARDTSGAAEEAIGMLEAAHREVSGGVLAHIAITATTDARFFGLYGGMPSLVYGPKAERIHGYDERVFLPSVRRVTQSIALFVADWCGLQADE
ncbi:ArgE/DapE family deacylase [Phyllobacterium endophyticum]|nr:ArgE/DapE family deacylase [Phyllobacterium endophyticum]TXR50556.1 ArgE/DapE family deacylase [Phyllobacterium endophyticum]